MSAPPRPTRAVRVRARLGLATLAALAFLAGACGDDDGGNPALPATGEDTTATSGGTGDDGGGDDGECRFVSTEAVQAVFGEAMELRAAGRGCVFGDGEVTLQFTFIAIQIDPEEYADEAVESCDEGTVVEVDAGDRAYSCILFVGPLATLYEGDELVVINTSGVEDEDEEAVRDLLAELLPDVTTG